MLIALLLGLSLFVSVESLLLGLSIFVVRVKSLLLGLSIFVVRVKSLLLGYARVKYCYGQVFMMLGLSSCVARIESYCC